MAKGRKKKWRYSKHSSQPKKKSQERTTLTGTETGKDQKQEFSNYFRAKGSDKRKREEEHDKKKRPKSPTMRSYIMLCLVYERLILTTVYHAKLD